MGIPVGVRRRADQPPAVPTARVQCRTLGNRSIKGSKLYWSRQPAFSLEPGDGGAHIQTRPWAGGLRSSTPHREAIAASRSLTPAEVLAQGEPAPRPCAREGAGAGRGCGRPRLEGAGGAGPAAAGRGLAAVVFAQARVPGNQL